MTRIAAALALLFSITIAAPASAGPPTEALRAYVDKLFALLEDPSLKEPGRAAERSRAVRGLAEDAFDFNESARRSLAAHWDARTPAERAKFARLFTDLIDQAYLSRIALDGERLVLDSETITNQEAIVKGRALSKSGGATPVLFYLQQDPASRWRLYDVSFEGMSLVSNYRAQFNKIIRGSSFDELVARLEAKTRTEAQASTPAEQPSKAP